MNFQKWEFFPALPVHQELKIEAIFSQNSLFGVTVRACMRKTPHLPDPGLRGEIQPSKRILCIFILHLHDERNTNGIVKSHLTRGGISPG